MIKRFILLVFALFLASCTVNKPVVRTTKTVHTKPRTTVASNPKTTSTSKPVAVLCFPFIIYKLSSIIII